MNAPIRWAFHFHACHLQQLRQLPFPCPLCIPAVTRPHLFFSLFACCLLLPCCSLLLPQCVVARCKSETFANLGPGTHKIHTHTRTHTGSFSSIIFGPRISLGKAKHTHTLRHTHAETCTCMIDKYIDRDSSTRFYIQTEGMWRVWQLHN